MRRPTWTLLSAGCLLLASSCTGLIGGGEDGSCPNCPTDPAAELDTTRYPRLSHAQWENTVRDLFYLDDVSGESASFTGDPPGGMFDNNEAVLMVPPGLWADYQLAAESLSERIADDPALLERIAPPGMEARSFIESFGKRAYRRPLSAEEIDAYLALFAQGQALVQGSSDFAKGVKLTLQAFLQAPDFVYRVQWSSDIGDDGLIRLSGWEIATKLSYMLWNTMPDDALFTAAASGKLDTAEGVLEQAQRMMDDERAQPVITAFHAQLYDFDRYHDLYKDEIIFPEFVPEMGADMQREAEMFVQDVVESGGGLNELLTAPFTYVNDRLAPLYGLEGTFGSEFTRVDLDPEERAGFLTRLGFLASNATPKEQNTIHRGIFVNRRILCNEIPDPPDNVPGLPPASDFDTNRERVEAHTGKGTCGQNCHYTLINPPGYALEHYNAVGSFQETEHDNAINALAEYRIDDEPVSFDGAIELSNIIAGSEQAHRCYAQFWLEFAYGRAPQEADDKSLEELTRTSRTGVKALLLALTQTAAFRTRAPAKEVSP
jgi:hypothetical protein